MSDRFYDSTIAYQGYGRGLSLDTTKAITLIATKSIIPDITFLLDIELGEMYKRKGVLEDRVDSSGYEFYEKVRDGYLSIAKEESTRVKVINGMKTIEECHTEMKQYFNELFNLKYIEAR